MVPILCLNVVKYVIIWPQIMNFQYIIFGFECTVLLVDCEIQQT